MFNSTFQMEAMRNHKYISKKNSIPNLNVKINQKIKFSDACVNLHIHVMQKYNNNLLFKWARIKNPLKHPIKPIYLPYFNQPSLFASTFPTYIYLPYLHITYPNTCK